MKPPHNGNGDLVPPRLRVWFAVIAQAPWTNIKTLNALVLVNLTGVFLVAVSMVPRIVVDESLFNAWLIFVGSLLGITTLGQIGKRATYKPAPPTAPDTEDVIATQGTASAQRTATHATASSDEEEAVG